MNVYLISSDFIKSMTNVSDNLSDKYLQSAIRESQDEDLQSVLGTKLYEKIMSLVAAGSISDASNAVYKSVLDKSQYFLAYSAISKLCLIVGAKINNIGVNQTSDQNVYTLGINDTMKVQSLYNDKADYYKGRLQDYLRENHQSIPELCNNSCYDVHSNTYSAASTGIFLGGARGKGVCCGEHHCHNHH